MPITIGAITTVPNPGTPITSPWAQAVSGMVVHVFASKAALDAGWATGPSEGQFAYTIAERVLWVRGSSAGWRRVVDTSYADRAWVAVPAPGVVDATTSTAAFSPWINCGNVTIPTYATIARINLAVNGFYDQTGAGNDYLISPSIGSAISTAAIPIKGIGVGTRLGSAAAHAITLSGTGAQNLQIQAKKVAGSGVMRADGSTVITADVWFQ